MLIVPGSHLSIVTAGYRLDSLYPYNTKGTPTGVSGSGQVYRGTRRSLEGKLRPRIVQFLVH